MQPSNRAALKKSGAQDRNPSSSSLTVMYNNSKNMSPCNVGWSSWGSVRGGLPQKAPEWSLAKVANYGILNDFCTVEEGDKGTVFAVSAKRQAIALAVADGSTRWETHLPDKSSYGIAVNEDVVCAPPYLLDRNSGKIVEDFSSQVYMNLRETLPLPIRAGFAWFVTGASGKRLLVYRMDQGKSILARALSRPNVGVCGDKLYGLLEDRFVCLELGAGTLLWSHTVPFADNGQPMMPSGQGSMVVGDRLYLHLNFDELRCLDRSSGELLWVSASTVVMDRSDAFQHRPPNGSSVTDDRVYLFKQLDRDGFLQAFDASNGRLLWTRQFCDARLSVIAGDLLIGSQNDRPTAWDRYTGETVWQAADRIPGLFHAAVCGRYYVYTSTVGSMHGYRWEQPYLSPAAHST